MSAGSSGVLTVLIIGILIMAGEFRHGTVTSTFLVSPKRGRVVGAKIVASALVGAAIAMAAAVLTLAVSVPWLASKAHPRRHPQPQRRSGAAWRHRRNDDLRGCRCRAWDH